jgi:hypothetical protein
LFEICYLLLILVVFLSIVDTLFGYKNLGKGDPIKTIWRDTTAESILERLSDLKNYPDEALAPYEEFKVSRKIYYFTPGGFLYRKDAGTEEVGGFFCGYLTDEAWHHRRTDDR